MSEERNPGGEVIKMKVIVGEILVVLMALIAVVQTILLTRKVDIFTNDKGMEILEGTNCFGALDIFLIILLVGLVVWLMT